MEIIRFPASVNLSDSIENVATVPGTAKNAKDATEFVKFLLSAEGRNILKDTGQPPVVPAIRKGNVPADLNSSLNGCNDWNRWNELKIVMNLLCLICPSFAVHD